MSNGAQYKHQTNKHARMHILWLRMASICHKHGMPKYSKYDSHKGGPILDSPEQELVVNLLSTQEQKIILKKIQNMF